MYFKITARPIPANQDPPFELKEHGVSLVQTMTYLANSMLDHLYVGRWAIQVDVDDPQPVSQAPRERGVVLQVPQFMVGEHVKTHLGEGIIEELIWEDSEQPSAAFVRLWESSTVLLINSENISHSNYDPADEEN